MTLKIIIFQPKPFHNFPCPLFKWGSSPAESSAAALGPVSLGRNTFGVGVYQNRVTLGLSQEWLCCQWQCWVLNRGQIHPWQP